MKRLWLPSWAGGSVRTTPIPFRTSSRMLLGVSDVLCGSDHGHVVLLCRFSRIAQMMGSATTLAAVKLVKIPSARGGQPKPGRRSETETKDMHLLTEVFAPPPTRMEIKNRSCHMCSRSGFTLFIKYLRIRARQTLHSPMSRC